ncbi:MAG TPA: serine hydrolase [Chitinophagaceae bacterium]|nr:serine hydrolase [Chitinophagaceae bacterium]
MKRCFIPALLFLCLFGNAQPRSDQELKEILAASNDPLLQEVIRHPEVYRYQIIYTQIDRNKKNKPLFRNYYLNVDSLTYFNPASTVKLPLAFLSLEKLNGMKGKGVDMNTLMQFDSSRPWQRKLYADSTSESGKPSIAHFIRKALLVSDNDAYNRMYQFVGQQAINRRLHEMGYPDLRISRQFMGLTVDQNRYTNPIRFIDKNGKLIYLQPEAYNPDAIDFSHINKMGKGYLNAKDSLINEPIDFTFANNMTVEHLQGLLRSVMFPGSVTKKQRFHLTEEDYAFLYRYLSQYPSESDYPKYDTAKFYDSYVKFFFRDSTHLMPEYIRVFNKVGWAYGCLTDVSYVVDFKNQVEFMLTATIYVNADGILNDDKYEYETVGWPFMYKLGQTIYSHELKRPRKFRPDLSVFRLEYQKRKTDGRPVIREVDN